MKQIKFFVGLVAITALFLMSCSKEEGIGMGDGTNTGGNGKLYPVSFTTKLNFGTEITPLSKYNDSIIHPSDTIPYLPGDTTQYNDTIQSNIYYQYIVYDLSGGVVKSKIERGNEINDELFAGNYKIAIIASDNADFLNSNLYPRNYYYDSVSYPKAFFTSFDYRVDSINMDTTATNNVVTLNRMWGEIDVKILDRATCIIPASVRSIAVEVEGYSRSFIVASQNGVFEDWNTKTTELTVSEFRNTDAINSLVSYHAQNKTSKVSLVVTYNDFSQKTILLASPSVKKGVRTTLKGSLGDILKETPSNQELNSELFLEDTWNEETISF